MPSLDFESSRMKLKLLVYETEQFCKDPVNIVMTEKRYMVRRFWRMLVDQSRKIFAEARADTERWLQHVPLPLETRIKDHKAQLEARLVSLGGINDRGGAMQAELHKLQGQRRALEDELQLITRLVAKMRDIGAAPGV